MNVETIEQEMEQEEQLSKIDDTNREILDAVNEGKDTMIFKPEEMINYRLKIIRILQD